MFFVELTEGDDGEEDEIDKSIKEIHQSAQKLSITNCNTAFSGAPNSSSLRQGKPPINAMLSEDVGSDLNWFRWRSYVCEY